jgi:hypothetical protein
VPTQVVILHSMGFAERGAEQAVEVAISAEPGQSFSPYSQEGGTAGKPYVNLTDTKAVSTEAGKLKVGIK